MEAAVATAIAITTIVAMFVIAIVRLSIIWYKKARHKKNTT